jgi:hypothetical protein
LACPFLSRAKFRGYELSSSEIARLWNTVRTDVAALGYDVVPFATPSMRVFYDVPQKDFLKLYTAHRKTGDEKEAEEYRERIDYSGVMAFTHAHFDKPTRVFTLTLIFVRKGAGHFAPFDRLILHEMAQLFEVFLGLETGTLVKRLNLGHEHH